VILEREKVRARSSEGERVRTREKDREREREKTGKKERERSKNRMTTTEEYNATQILRMRSPSSSNTNSASKEPTERVHGFNVNNSSGTTRNEVEALRALRISSARTNASSSTITNEGTTNEKEEDDEKQEEEEFDVMALPMTPKKGGSDVDKKDTEELMTPRSLSKRIGKPDIKVMLATGNNEPIDVMRGRGIVTSMTLRAKAEGIKRVPEKMFTTTGGKSRFSSNSNSNGRNNEDEDDEDDGNKVNLVLPAEVLRNAAQKEKQSNENDTEEENNTFDDPKEYRKLMVKLSDLSYIHIKAAVGVDNATGNVIERDFWLPLDETKTIGDLKRYVEEANTLETMKMMRNRNKMITNGSKNSTSPPKTTAMNNSKLAPVNEDEELESVVLLKGRELADSRRLMDENVTHNTTLHFYVKKDAQNVTVKMH
jgi:hypothetical protein